jgi:hypothetical protein
LALTSVVLPLEALADDWKPIAIGKYFSFEAPASTKKCPNSAKPEDSIVEEFCGPGFRLGFDYGPYSYDLSGYNGAIDYALEHLTIDGRTAFMVTGPGGNAWGCKKRVTAVYLVVSKGYGQSTKLEMHGCASKPEVIGDLQRIFRSLKFSNA